MTEQNKKLSRRDAIKLIGAAAGAAALANLPSKWSKPEVINGVLPAHAQTSAVCVDYALTVEVLSTDGTGAHVQWFTYVDVELDWDGTAGSILRMPCTSICLALYTLLFGGTTATYRFTTISHQFIVPDDTNILINMETGEYALNGATPPSGCAWSALSTDLSVSKSTFSTNSQ